MSVGKGLSSLIPPKNINLSDEKKESGGDELNYNKQNQEIKIGFDSISQKTTLDVYTEISGKEGKKDSIFHIEVEKIKNNPYQPRREFNDTEINELAESIKRFGILQPLVAEKEIRETENGVIVEYRLIAGERRLRAAKVAGLERVPVIIREKESPQNNLEIALIENIQRKDLNPIEEAKAYARLQDEFGLTQREIALKVGKSRESISNSLRLLNLPQDMQNALVLKKITESQARILLSLDNPKERELIFQNILNQKFSVRDTQNFISRKRNFHNESQNIEPELVVLQKELEEKLDLKVKIIKGKEDGKIIIKFYTAEDIKNILDKLN
jgi:ParB family chromosome partitioning protein